MKKKFILVLAFSYLLNEWLPLYGQPGPQRYDVVVDEIMADPTPQTGLPNNEWIELKNTSSSPVSLAGWKIADAASSSGPMPAFILKPDSLVIICAASSIATMSALGTAISVSGFPTLDNNGDIVALRDLTGKTIHALSYDISWYGNELKKLGGWTLEMIDTGSPCTGSENWKASTDPHGGTPGKKNSIDALNQDQTPPQLLRSYTINESSIVLVFDEPIDSLGGATIANYSLEGGVAIDSAITLAPVFDKVRLKLITPMQVNQVYSVTVTNVTDCKNNSIGMFNNTKFGLPRDVVVNEMVVNEILFNPRPNAYDYVEFYNKSDKIIDAARLYMANRNNANAVSSITPLTANPFLIFPGEYVVVTEDMASLSREYLVKKTDRVLEVSSLPSFPDDRGFVLLLNFQGDIVDEVDYFDDWHFKLINDAEGVALERLDPYNNSNDRNNWHSAGSTAGYGTPGYKNSQYQQPQNSNTNLEVSPRIFSPDNDGFNDVARIQYKVDRPGYVTNITIFDASGRPVRYLVHNAILALSGYWNWNGLDDQAKRLPIGTYVVLTEIFNLQGDKHHFKNTVVLARKLN